MRVSACRRRLDCGTASLATGCGGRATRARRATPYPAPEVALTAQEKQVWAPLPPDRSGVPVLLYHGIGPESDFAERGRRVYGVDGTTSRSR